MSDWLEFVSITSLSQRQQFVLLAECLNNILPKEKIVGKSVPQKMEFILSKIEKNPLFVAWLESCHAQWRAGTLDYKQISLSKWMKLYKGAKDEVC